MITDLAPLRTTDVPIQTFRPGSALPRPDARDDLLRLGCAIADVPALATALCPAGPRIRVEAVADGGWPDQVDVAALVTGGVVEFALQLPEVLDGPAWVQLVGFLVGAREHGLAVEWRLPTNRPGWGEPEMLHHLPPPSAGEEAAVQRWTDVHRFGQLYWRRGPGFVIVVDARGDSRIRYVIDEAPLVETFLALNRPGPPGSLPAGTGEQLAELVEAGLAVQSDGWAVGLAYRLRHTPMPGYQV